MRGKRWRQVAATAVVAGITVPAVARWVRRRGSARRAIDMRMTLVVERPVTKVFEFCRDFENFPGVVGQRLRVADTQDGRSHWTVRSPSNDSIAWDAVVTKYVPNSVIGWESVAGSPVRATGLMRFSPLSERETRVDIALKYLPLRTSIAEALHALIGASNTERLRANLAGAARGLAVNASEPPAPRRAS